MFDLATTQGSSGSPGRMDCIKIHQVVRAFNPLWLSGQRLMVKGNVHIESTVYSPENFTYISPQ